MSLVAMPAIRGVLVAWTPDWPIVYRNMNRTRRVIALNYYIFVPRRRTHCSNSAGCPPLVDRRTHVARTRISP